MTNEATTAKTVAEWMLQELTRVQFLYQEEVVYHIASKFGDKFTYDNQNGNLSIDRRVLAEFRKITSDTVVWERGERMWRMRADYDEPGKRQAE